MLVYVEVSLHAGPPLLGGFFFPSRAYFLLIEESGSLISIYGVGQKLEIPLGEIAPESCGFLVGVRHPGLDDIVGADGCIGTKDISSKRSVSDSISHPQTYLKAS